VCQQTGTLGSALLVNQWDDGGAHPAGVVMAEMSCWWCCNSQGVVEGRTLLLDQEGVLL
jgi:hypothetical protein